MREVALGVLVEGDLHRTNVGCITAERGSLLVDAPIVPSDALKWRQALREYGVAAPLYVLLTDGHPSHALGSSHFDAPAVANERAYRGLERFTPTMQERVLDAFRDWAPDAVTELQDLQVRPPDITFDHDLVFYLGGLTVYMERVGGHSPACSFVHVRERDVLFAGDLVASGHPPFLGQGHLEEWLVGLERLRALQPAVVVPGHGPVGGPELIDSTESFLLRLRSGVQELITEGRSRAETATRMIHLLDEFDIEPSWQKRAERTFRASVGRAFEELKRQRGEKLGEVN